MGRPWDLEENRLRFKFHFPFALCELSKILNVFEAQVLI